MSKALTFFLFSVAIIACCYDCRSSQVESSHSTSICDIQRNKSAYIGKTVLLHAVYETDKSNFTYLRDKRSTLKECSTHKIIELASVSLMHDASVLNFFKRGDLICQEKKRPVVCNLTANVTAEVQIMDGGDGLTAYLLKVIDFNYQK